MNRALIIALSSVIISGVVKGHGRLLDPPGRSSLWRYPEFNAKVNYQDHELNCGGFQNQWETHQGKCGVCGDPWQGPLENVPPGKYAAGIISRNYDEGDTIISKVQITADHKGYFEFRLCANNNISLPVDQECLDKTVLRILDATEEEPTKYYTHGQDWKAYELRLKLPVGVFGSQCVLQWRYHTGNSWGCDGNECCIGCGNKQEEFYACADISIRPSGATVTPRPETTSTQPTTVTRRNCFANALWGAVPGMHDWCKANCASGKDCPKSHCMCLGSDSGPVSHDPPVPGQHCLASGLWSGSAPMNHWCATHCKVGHCPGHMCKCQ